MTNVQPSHVIQNQEAVFAFLADPASHGLEAPVERIDTHGAVVFLAGDHAYKVKRAVRFPFMDYSSLARRRAACEAEITINNAFAPQLYLDCIAITRGDDGLQLGGAGSVAEWAVKMRRFDESRTLDRLAEAGRLDTDIAGLLAPVVLAAHATAPVHHSPQGAARLIRCAEENRTGLAEFPKLFAPAPVDQRLKHVIALIDRLRPLLDARAAGGFVRRCHGDMHLRNIALIDDQPVLFDAIEFSDEIATSDILYDLAFLLMDLWERGYFSTANALFCRYLWYGAPQNLEALGAMPLMLSLRAAIRAKVSAATLPSLSPTDRPGMEDAARRYFDFAEALMVDPEPQLIAIGGLSGTGKSHLAAALAPHIGTAPGALVLRSDIERKIQAGAAETAKLDSAHYTQSATGQVYQGLRDKTNTALSAGWPVIVDAVHARTGERAALAAMARSLKLPFRGLWLDASLDERQHRVLTRRADASDADAQIAARQESYAIGEMDWQRIDARGSAEDTYHAALKVLGIKPVAHGR